ncbi:MAG: hypothetical protein AAFV51_13345, partial [Pseudomonadota bacterium]
PGISKRTTISPCRSPLPAGIPGYTILEETKALTVGAREEWTIEMEPSNIPLRLQRLGRTFKF